MMIIDHIRIPHIELELACTQALSEGIFFTCKYFLAYSPAMSSIRSSLIPRIQISSIVYMFALSVV